MGTMRSPMQNDPMYYSPISDNGSGLDFTYSDGYYQDSMYRPLSSTLSVFPNHAGFNGMPMSIPSVPRVPNSFTNPSFFTTYSTPPRCYAPNSAAAIGSNYSNNNNTFMPAPTSSTTMSAYSDAYVPSSKHPNLDCTLDIDKVRRHEDKRTTLMIRNIPNW